jgi:integrase
MRGPTHSGEPHPLGAQSAKRRKLWLSCQARSRQARRPCRATSRWGSCWRGGFITPSREPGTIRGYATPIRAIDEQIGTVKLAKLTALQLDEAYAGWLRKGHSPNTIHHRHAILRTALRQAVKWGLVPRAATDKASPPPLRSKPIAAVPADDVLRLYGATAEHQPTLALAIYLEASTGLRRGELCALRWSDIDETWR